MSRMPLLSVAALLTGCVMHRGPEPRVQRQVGTYDYRANVGSHEEQGTFTIAADSVTLGGRDAECVYRPKLTIYSGGPYIFDCGGNETGVTSYRISLDAVHLARSTWQARLPVMRYRRICSVYAPPV